MNQDDPNVLEIWNLVFMQYVKVRDTATKIATGKEEGQRGYRLEALREQHIDTGMGLERLVSILQEESSNYQTDTFRTIMQKIYELRLKRRRDEEEKKKMGGDEMKNVAVVQPYQDNVGLVEDPEGVDAAYRVVADHVRTLVFAIGDRVSPGSVGRGYVLRRILRRWEEKEKDFCLFVCDDLVVVVVEACSLLFSFSHLWLVIFLSFLLLFFILVRGVLYGTRTLNLKHTFFSDLAPSVIELYSKTYPELQTEKQNILKQIQHEEELFQETWTLGQQDFDKMSKDMMNSGRTQVTGEEAARLHQERGFPIDLTRLLAEERDMTVDENRFEELRTEHVRVSRGELGSGSKEEEYAEIDSLTRQMLATENSKGGGWTTIVDHEDVVGGDAEVLCVSVNREGSGQQLVNRLGVNDVGRPVGVVLSRSSFYEESGGQVIKDCS